MGTPVQKIRRESNSISFLEELTEAWRRERPDVDTSGKGLIYAIYILERGMRRQTERQLRQFDIRYGEYMVLTCLRRAGHPFELSPSTLVETLELTSGAISQTLQKLEDRRFINRRRSRADSRQVTVKLTKMGRTLVDSAFEDVTAQENTLLAEVPESQQKELLNGLTTLMVNLRLGK